LTRTLKTPAEPDRFGCQVSSYTWAARRRNRCPDHAAATRCTRHRVSIGQLEQCLTGRAAPGCSYSPGVHGPRSRKRLSESRGRTFRVPGPHWQAAGLLVLVKVELETRPAGRPFTSVRIRVASLRRTERQAAPFKLRVRGLGRPVARRSAYR
jgi:hypothetical protein